MKAILLLALLGFAYAELTLNNIGHEELTDIILARFNNEDFSLSSDVNEDDFKTAVVGAVLGEGRHRGPESFTETINSKATTDAKIKTRTKTVDEPSTSQTQGVVRVEFNRRRHGEEPETNETEAPEHRRGRRVESVRVRAGFASNAHNTKSNTDAKFRTGVDVRVLFIENRRGDRCQGEEKEEDHGLDLEEFENELDEEFEDEFGVEGRQDDDEFDTEGDLEGRRDRRRRRGGKRITVLVAARAYQGVSTTRGSRRTGSRALVKATVLVHPRGSPRLATVFTQVRGRQINAVGAGRHSRRVATESRGTLVTAVRRGRRGGYGDEQEEEMLNENLD